MTARRGFISPRGWSKLGIGKEDRICTGSGFQASLAVNGESNLTKPRWQQCLGGWSKLANWQEDRYWSNALIWSAIYDRVGYFYDIIRYWKP